MLFCRYIVALTKCDIASVDDIKAASEYASKQKKIQLPVVEVSAMQNVNVTTAVIFAGSLGNQKLGISRPKVCTYFGTIGYVQCNLLGDYPGW